MSRLTLIEGNGDVVGYLETVLERAKRGEVSAVAIVMLSEPEGDPWVGWGFVHRVDALLPWARLVSGIQSASHDLLTNGL